MYKVVVFDNGGVLIDESHEKWSRRISEHFGLPFDTVYQHYSRGEAWKLYRLGKVSEETFWEMGNASSGFSLDIAVLRRIVREERTPIPGTPELLQELYDRRFLLALLNNEGREWDTYSKKTNKFYSLFAVAIGSYSVGIAKPDARIFHVLEESLAEYGVVPSECVYVDDKEQNVSAARKVGMSGIVYVDPSQIRKKLTDLKLLRGE